MKAFPLLPTVVLALALPCAECDAQLLWDTSAAGGIQGGSGNWLGTVTWSGILGGRTQWVDGNVAIFNAGSGTVTLNGAVTANGMVFNVSGYTISGSSVLTLGGTSPAISITTAGHWALIDAVLSGTGGLTKNGAGDLLLRRSGSTYAGPTIINAGRVFVATNPLGHVLPLGTPVVLADAAGVSLVFEFANASLGSLAGGGAAGGSLVIDDPSFFSVGSDNSSTTFGGVITATGSFNKTGSGTLELTNNANSFAGSISVSSGTLRVARLSPLVGGDPLGNVSRISLGGRLWVPEGGSKRLDLSLSGAAAIDVTGPTASLAITGTLTGGGGFTKSGPGTLRLIGTGTYLGPTTITGGTLDATSGDPISAASTVTLSNTNGVRLLLDSDVIGGLAGGGLNGGDVILQGVNPTLNVGANGASTSYGGIISGTGGSLVKTGTGTLTFTFINTFTGNVAIGNGALSVSTVTNAGTSGLLGAGTTVTLGGIGTTGRLLFTGTAGDSTNRAIILSAGGGAVEVSEPAGALTLSGPVSGSGGLAKTGPGTLVLSGSNNYGGPTVVAAGKLHASGGNAIGDGSALNVANVAGAVIELQSGNETAGSLGGGGANGGIVALNNNTLTVGGDATFTMFAGMITGGGGLTKTGPGTMTLSGINTFTGTTTVNEGILRLAGGAAISDASAVIVAPGGVFDLNGTNETIGSLTGGGTVLLGAATLTLGANGSPLIFEGIISGSGGLTMSGTGTLTLSGANNFTGAASVTGGTLVLDSGLGTPGGVLSVNAGATVQARNVVNRPISGAGTIAATGTLFLGDFDSSSGVAFAGTLAVGTNTVLLADANTAELGAATTLNAGGRLQSLNGAAIGSGETLTVAPSASATIGGTFINNGTVNGPTAAAQSLTFTDDVSGAGGFTGSVTFSDGYSPGMSTAAVSLENFTFDGTTTLHIEIGGLVAGSQYDQLNFTGSGVLGGELSVSLVNGFIPQAGNTFTFIQGGALSGAFAKTSLPPPGLGLTWEFGQSANSATLTVVTTPIDLRIVSVETLPNEHVVLTCVGAPGQLNRIEANSSLAPASWQTIASIMADGAGNFAFTDTAAPGIRRRFYRLSYP